MNESLRVTIDVVAFSLQDNKLCVLLLKGSSEKNAWHLPESSIDLQRDEQLEDAATRALYAASKLSPLYLEQVQTRGSKSRDPRGWSLSVVYYALVGKATFEKNPDFRWLNIDNIKNEALASDHLEIIGESLKRFQNKSLYTSIPIFLLPQEFTLTEVQKAYETVLGFNVEKKSLRRRLLDANFLKETGNIRRASHRPAQLYQLSLSKPYYFARIIEGVRER